VFATPTSNGLARTSARAGLRGLFVLAAMCALLSGIARAQDGDDQVTTDFYSFVPAAPDIKFPDLEGLKFWTDDLKKGKNAYRDGNDQRALKYFRRASDDGNIVADWYLGHMYRLGRGVDKSDAKAFSYYVRVADQFNADESSNKKLRIMVDSLVRVADYYRAGNKASAIPEDPARAIRIYKLASTYGHPAAEFGLGVMNLHGQGMNAKPAQGLRWLNKSAKKHHAPAQAYLGNLYWRGEFVRQDRTRGLMWYILAQSTARPDENPEIIDRLDVMLASASEEERIEAEAHASVWADQNPVKNAKNLQQAGE
jgi:uncharacterized protein